MIWVDIVVSLSLPFVAFAVFAYAWLWLMQRTPASDRAISRTRELAPPVPRESIVDHAGNVRHEWAVDLEVQRLRRSERRW